MRGRPLRLADVMAEPCIYLMWPRAALLQLAHPGIAPTEIQSGAYGHRSAARWAATIGYLRTVADGDADRIADLVRVTNRIHAKVRLAHEPVPGQVRPPFDPQLQLWVAATWFISIIDVYQLFLGPIDPDDLDEIYEEFTVVGTALQLDRGDWPADRARFEQYVDYTMGELTPCIERSDGTDPERPTVADIAVGVFGSFSLPSRYVRRQPEIRLLTWHLGGDRLRRLYGVDWTDTDRQVTATLSRRARLSYRLWPKRSRHRHTLRRQTRFTAGVTETERLYAARRPATETKEV